jgi:hypothetical protein
MSTTNRELLLSGIRGVLGEYNKITLKEMEESKLMSRYDQKFVFPITKLQAFLEELKNEYKVLSVNNQVMSSYENIYFDTPELKSYHDHHNKRASRYKIRVRKYNDSGDCFLELKMKRNKGITEKKRINVDSLFRELNSTHLDFLKEHQRGLPENLVPGISNEFMRITLVNEERHERVTIDLLIHFKNENRTKDLDEIVIAELKQEHHFHDSGFKKLMLNERIFSASFSKYCMGTLLTHPEIKSPMELLNVLLLEEFKFPVLFSAPEFIDFFVRFAFNFLVAYIVIRWIYYPVHKNKDYLFTYFLFNIIIFVLCYMMKNSQLQMGVAFGLFAVFSVLRYRTMNVLIMDMAYLFLVISIGVINSLSSEYVSIVEVVFANVLVVSIIYIMEKVWLVRHASSKTVIYEKIENIKPENYDKLLLDLKERTGLDVHRVEIGRIDFMTDVARVKIFYFENK